jgi:hypothetical protein
MSSITCSYDLLKIQLIGEFSVDQLVDRIKGEVEAFLDGSAAAEYPDPVADIGIRWSFLYNAGGRAVQIDVGGQLITADTDDEIDLADQAGLVVVHRNIGFQITIESFTVVKINHDFTTNKALRFYRGEPPVNVFVSGVRSGLVYFPVIEPENGFIKPTVYR